MDDATNGHHRHHPHQDKGKDPVVSEADGKGKQELRCYFNEITHSHTSSLPGKIDTKP